MLWAEREGSRRGDGLRSGAAPEPPYCSCAKKEGRIKKKLKKACKIWSCFLSVHVKLFDSADDLVAVEAPRIQDIDEKPQGKKEGVGVRRPHSSALFLRQRARPMLLDGDPFA